MDESRTGQRAVIDRVVGDQAVVIDGDGEEHILAVEDLPKGAKEGTWLRVRHRSGALVVLGMDAAQEAHQRADVKRRLDRVRERNSGRPSRFDRSD